MSEQTPNGKKKKDKIPFFRNYFWLLLGLALYATAKLLSSGFFGDAAPVWVTAPIYLLGFGCAVYWGVKLALYNRKQQ